MLDLYRAARIDMARITEAEQPSLDDLSRHLQLSQLIADRVRCAVLLQLYRETLIAVHDPTECNKIEALITEQGDSLRALGGRVVQLAASEGITGTA